MDVASELLARADTYLWFGAISGLLSVIAFIPYIVDTLSGDTQLQRASWFIWSVLGSIALGAQIYEGASDSLWFVSVQVSGTVIVFLLSLRAGTGKLLVKGDREILLLAGIGLVIWYFTEQAAFALVITISISLLAGLATAAKAYRAPESETLGTWMISLLASIFAIAALGDTDLVLLAYPLYLFTLYLCFVLAILLGRIRLSSPGIPTRG